MNWTAEAGGFLCFFSVCRAAMGLLERKNDRPLEGSVNRVRRGGSLGLPCAGAGLLPAGEGRGAGRGSSPEGGESGGRSPSPGRPEKGSRDPRRN